MAESRIFPYDQARNQESFFGQSLDEDSHRLARSRKDHGFFYGRGERSSDEENMQRPTKDYVGRGPKGYRRSDERIREDICDRLVAHPGIDASDLEVKVDEGMVSITGRVDDRDTKHQVEDLVEDVHGIKDLDIRISVHRIDRPMVGR